MTISIHTLTRRLAFIVGAVALVAAMGGSWSTRTAAAAPPAAPHAVTRPSQTAAATDDDAPPKKTKKNLAGKLNLNVATEEQLMMLPTVGPSKAERIVEWRKKNGGFKRVADLRRVKGFGYKTFKRLEPLLDVKGETTLAAK
jgi:competence ComEA-like helix-hairpin-helix protein